MSSIAINNDDDGDGGDDKDDGGGGGGGDVPTDSEGEMDVGRGRENKRCARLFLSVPRVLLAPFYSLRRPSAFKATGPQSGLSKSLGMAGGGKPTTTTYPPSVDI